MLRASWTVQYSLNAEKELEELFRQNAKLEAYWQGNLWFYQKTPEAGAGQHSGILSRTTNPSDPALPRLCVFYMLDDKSGIVEILRVQRAEAAR
jgi:hypothetical protein